MTFENIWDTSFYLQNIMNRDICNMIFEISHDIFNINLWYLRYLMIFAKFMIFNILFDDILMYGSVWSCSCNSQHNYCQTALQWQWKNNVFVPSPEWPSPITSHFSNCLVNSWAKVLCSTCFESIVILGPTEQIPSHSECIKIGTKTWATPFAL
jgi:hypothetical protein